MNGELSTVHHWNRQVLGRWSRAETRKPGDLPLSAVTRELIAARVERALSRIDKTRITLNPDCGFAPGSAAKVDTDEVYLKLKAEAEAARMLRAKYA